MAKQTLVFESPKELSLKNGMLVISDNDLQEVVYRSIEDIQMIMVDHHSVRLSIPLLTKLSLVTDNIMFNPFLFKLLKQLYVL